MKLIIECDKNITSSFIRWLIKLIKIQILSNINNKRLVTFNSYINTRNVFQCSYPVNVKKILLQMVNSMYYVRVGKYYVITFNPSIPLLNTRFKMVDVINFVTYGNTEIRGVPIISDVFTGIERNIEKYYKLYTNGLIL